MEFHTKLFSGDGSSDMYIITSLLAISYRGSITLSLVLQYIMAHAHHNSDVINVSHVI